MLLAREYAEELPEDDAQPIPRFVERQLRDRRLRAHQQLQLGDDGHDEAAVRAQGVPEPVSPRLDALVALDHGLEQERAERLGDGRVRHVSPVLIALAGQEEASLAHDRLVELANERRLADTSVSRDEHQLREATRSDPVEGSQDLGGLLLATSDPVWNLETLRHVALPQGKCLDPPLRGQRGEAPLEVELQAKRAAVPVLGRLGDELGHDVGEHGWRARLHLRQRRGNARQVAMNPPGRIIRLEWEPPRAQFVECDAQRIEVGARVDGPAGAARLFWRQIGQ